MSLQAVGGGCCHSGRSAWLKMILNGCLAGLTHLVGGAVAHAAAAAVTDAKDDDCEDASGMPCGALRDSTDS